MENEPEVEVELPIHSIIMYQSEGMWVIKDYESGVTTQGESKIEALLMLADALRYYEDVDDIMEKSKEIFT